MPAWKDGRYFSFIAVHYVYIISWILITSVLLYIPGNISHVDSLLLASGAATQSGQNPVDLNSLYTSQQLTLWAVTMVTNVIFMHSLLVLARLSFFRKRFRSVVGQAKEARRNGDAENSRYGYGTIGLEMQKKTTQSGLECGNRYERDDSDQPRPQPINHIAASSAGPRITFDEASQLHHQRRISSSFQGAISSLPPLVWHGSIASYSDWDETQKDELGGTEYRALKTLFFILLGYFIMFHLFGIISLLCVILSHPQYGRVVDDIGVSKGWWAIFTAGSAFNDVGFTLSPNSMVSFNKVPLLLLVMTFLILIGNTGFPCMLRLIIWALAKIPDWGSWRREELEFLLDHPRRCFTLLFSSPDTWRLLGVLLVLNAVDLAIFILLDKVRPIQWHTWLTNGLFQVASTRTAGFTVTSLTDLHPAVQVSFVVMMYISAFPTAMAMRKTNVYEEKSLGIYEETTDNDGDDNHTNPIGPQSMRNDLGYHIQKQLSFDLWYIVLGTFLIALIEGDRLQQHKAGFSLFSVLFEVVSAYGTVGLSLGYAWTESSLCAQFRGVSKLVILAMQVRGRHRGLPYALDQAVLLPFELLSRGRGAQDWEEEEGYYGDDEDDGGWRGWLQRRRSNLSSLLSVTDGEHISGNGINERERLLP